MVKFPEGLRPLTQEERHAYVGLSAEILCLERTAEQPWSPSGTSPELAETALACMQYWKVRPVTAEAIDQAHRGDVSLKRDIADAAQARCQLGAEPDQSAPLTDILVAARLRWTSLDGPVLTELDSDATRYVTTAGELACLALAGETDKTVLEKRAAILEASSFDTASFRAAGQTYRQQPAIVALVAGRIRQCGSEDRARTAP